MNYLLVILFLLSLVLRVLFSSLRPLLAGFGRFFLRRVFIHLCPPHPSPPPPQGLAVPSASPPSTQREDGKPEGAEAGAIGEASTTPGEVSGGAKKPRWWMPERLRPTTLEELVSAGVEVVVVVLSPGDVVQQYRYRWY